MKFLGQYIQHFISRFRSDVYLENISSGTIASGGNLGLDSNNKIVKASEVGSSVDLTSEVTGILPVANGGTGANSLTSNSVLIGNSTSAINPSPNFTFDGDDLLLESANLQKPTFTLKNTNNSANPAVLSFVKDKGAAGADSDIVGRIDFTSDNDAQEQHPYGNIHASVSAARDGNEEGKIAINVCAFQSASGAIDGNVITGEGNGDSIVDVTLGAGATGVTTIAGTLTIGSTAFVNNSGVIQVATQGTIDHDSLANFVANEHIDWTGSSAGTIHSTNIPTLNQDTTGTATNATKQLVVTTHNFQLANTTGTFFYVPFNNLNESSAGTMANYWTRTVAPYDGTIKKIVVRSQTSLGTSCELRISKITDTTDALTSGTHVDNTSIDISTAHTSVITTMNTNSFSAGDVVGVALKRSAGTSAQVVVTIAWEYTT